jgi:hypothetical protein
MEPLFITPLLTLQFFNGLLIVYNKGRNLAGKIGLFPQSYTAPAPPSNGAPAFPPTSPPADSDAVTTDNSARILQPLNEESETETPPEHAPNIVPNIIAPVPQALPSSTFLNGEDGEGGDDEGKPIPGNHQRLVSNGSEEMMKATITDVQKAIEQLGRRHGPNEDGDGDGERSFSFASSRDEVETDTDYDMSDVDGGHADGGQGWHKGARRKLAAKARKAVEEAEKLEAMIGGAGISEAERRAAAPPIEVELSDESEDDERDYTSHSSVYPREHPHIAEEDDEAVAPAQPGKELPTEHDTPKRGSTGAQFAHDFTLPRRESSEAQIVTATRSSFPALLSPALPFSATSTVQTPDPVTVESVTSPVSPPPITSRPISPTLLEHVVTNTFPEPKRISASSPLREPVTGLPSPTGSFQWISANSTGVLSKNSSVSSSKSPGPASALSQPPVTASSMQLTLVGEKKDKADPGEWSVDDVADWLKGKGFDQEVQDKFIGA